MQKESYHADEEILFKNDSVPFCSFIDYVHYSGKLLSWSSSYVLMGN